MGLDMYLSKSTSVKNYDYMQPSEKTHVAIIKNNQLDTSIKTSRISQIIEDVMYWRKANHIHQWFVDHVQEGNDDCKNYYVSMEDLKTLASLCERVVETKDTDLLPTSSGFFYGSEEYDKYYYESCSETARVIRELLKEDSQGYYEYSSSW